MNNKKMGRPKIEIDFKKVEGMCAIHCTAEEICSVLDISEDTLGRRIQENFNMNFAEFYKKKSSIGRMSLRRNLFNQANNGNLTAMIWLSKQYLGMSDKKEFKQDIKASIHNVDNMSLEEIQKEIDELDSES